MMSDFLPTLIVSNVCDSMVYLSTQHGLHLAKSQLVKGTGNFAELDVTVKD